MQKELTVLLRAKQIMRAEADAVLEVTNRIGKSFEDAVDMLCACRGRVVVTGIGKTGIIGRKISATFASTGTPSLWMHPVEAVHGDMGMVLPGDVVLAVSNSGETEELVRLVPLVKKIGAHLIALTGNTNSTLAVRADIAIDTSVSGEACSMGLIPTSSTTAALAAGDALAVCLLEKKGFSLKDYAFYHSGGTIGRKMLEVKDIMRTGSMHAVVSEDMPVKDVLSHITRARAGSATVVGKGGRVCGIFTDGDLRRHIEKGGSLLTGPVSLFMTKDPYTVCADTLVLEALHIIKEKKIDELIVVDDGKVPQGVVDEKDILGMG